MTRISYETTYGAKSQRWMFLRLRHSSTGGAVRHSSCDTTARASLFPFFSSLFLASLRLDGEKRGAADRPVL
jgi:hypothetical protein